MKAEAYQKERYCPRCKNSSRFNMALKHKLSATQMNILMANGNKTASECGVTMKAMESLLSKGLIQRTNWDEPIWVGTERYSMVFGLTEAGREYLNKKKYLNKKEI